MRRRCIVKYKHPIEMVSRARVDGLFDSNRGDPSAGLPLGSDAS
jgi:hypothetical protein